VYKEEWIWDILRVQTWIRKGYGMPLHGLDSQTEEYIYCNFCSSMRHSSDRTYLAWLKLHNRLNVAL
jgi:hypothetical protein